MLQQTQTSRVAALLPAFLARFPDNAALAAATLGQVLSAWQGLGYNRRAANLHRAASMIQTTFGGILPADRDVLCTLPGIGPNTAGAIMAYAWNLPEPFVETNIRTVYIHHFAPWLMPSPTDRAILDLVRASMDKAQPRIWFWALMDYGVELKRTVGNLSRAAPTWRPQSTFEGSLRQARGHILRLLNSKAYNRTALLTSLTPADTDRLEQALADLSREGLVVAESTASDTLYRLP